MSQFAVHATLPRSEPFGMNPSDAGRMIWRVIRAMDHAAKKRGWSSIGRGDPDYYQLFCVFKTRAQS